MRDRPVLQGMTDEFHASLNNRCFRPNHSEGFAAVELLKSAAGDGNPRGARPATGCAGYGLSFILDPFPGATSDSRKRALSKANQKQKEDQAKEAQENHKGLKLTGQEHRHAEADHQSSH